MYPKITFKNDKLLLEFGLISSLLKVNFIAIVLEKLKHVMQERTQHEIHNKNENKRL